MFLDQVLFQQQCFGSTTGYRRLHVGNMRHKRCCLAIVERLLKVARQAILQIARLADIDDVILRIEHAIDTGPGRDRLHEGRDIKGSIWLTLHSTHRDVSPDAQPRQWSSQTVSRTLACDGC